MHQDANPKLLAIYREHLLPFFDQTEAVLSKPWWWPIANGATPSCYGLRDEEYHAWQSLRGQSSSSTPTRAGYDGFQGSLGARKGAIWVFGTRPSTGSFPTAGTDKLYQLLCAVEPGRGFLSHVHILDFAKFRGGGGDWKKSERMNALMWTKSFAVIEAEFEVLAPPRILMTKQAYQWMRDWLYGWACFLPNAEGRRIISLLEEIQRRARAVTSWWKKSANELMPEWQKALRLKLGPEVETHPAESIKRRPLRPGFWEDGGPAMRVIAEYVSGMLTSEQAIERLQGLYSKEGREPSTQERLRADLQWYAGKYRRRRA